MLFVEVPRSPGPPLLPAPKAVAPPQLRRLPIYDPIKVDYVSASALERFSPLFGGCWRKYFAEKGDQYPRVQSEAAALGTAVHEAHERWLRDGIPYDRTTKAGQIAAETLHLLPAPGTGTVEGEARFEYDGLTFLVKIDLHWAEGVSVSACKAIVLDHKTTGRPDHVKDTKAKLLDHPQAPLYAVWAMRRYRTAYAELRWNYVTTRKPYTPMPSWHMTSNAEVQEIMRAAIVPEAKKLLALIAHANRERAAGRAFTMFDIPITKETRHPEACLAFGGCPRRELCQITGIEEFDIMAQSNQPQMPAFIAELSNMNPAAQAPQQAPQAWPQQAPPAPPGFGPQGFAPAPSFAPQGFAPQAAPAPAPAPQQFAPQAFAPPQPPPVQQFVPPAPMAPVPGYGQAVNPPEAATPGAPPEKAKRGRKPATPGAAPVTLAAETVSHELLTIAAALASNPNVNPQQVSAFAKAIVTELEAQKG